MSDETKTPQAGEWWISYCDAIAYICGFDPDGDPVFLTDRKENAHVDTMSGFLENWHHEPLCTGWDWEPIDPATKALHELAITAGFDPLGLDPAEIAEKLIAKQQVTGCPGESPDRVPDNRPARDVIREIVKLLADSSMTDEESADMAFQIGKQWLDDNPEDPPPFAKPFTNSRSGTGIPKNNAPVESPDDWVDLPETHILRADIDEVSETGVCWCPVRLSESLMLGESGWTKARCRRRDLPVKLTPFPDAFAAITTAMRAAKEEQTPQPKRTPVRLWVSADVRWGDRYIVSVKDGNPNPERHQEVKFDGSRFYVEGIE